MNRAWIHLILLIVICGTLAAQHEHGGRTSDTTHGMQMEDEDVTMPSMIFPNVSMRREGSGTGWLPDASQLHAFHAQTGMWGIMMHGSVFFTYTNQNITRTGSRGESQLNAPNWFMLMASRTAGERGKFMVRGMFSLDRVTNGGAGYPLLFQTGESWEGKPLIDRQHPHDLISELGVAYSRSLSDEQGVFVYIGYPGEPALGPPTFMHRPSAMSFSDAPLGHHWQDATHISFGVATLGWQWKTLKLDGSVFTGREPDENRFNFDRPKFDSYSGRVSLNPSEELALQLSHGFLKSPEVLEPDIDVGRTTASVLYHRRSGEERFWTTSFVWGASKPVPHELQSSFLLESNFELNGGSLFGRIEFVQKPMEELGINGAGHEDLVWVNQFMVGAAKTLAHIHGLQLNLGGQASFNAVAQELRSVYGTAPVSLSLFVHLRPAPITMMGMGSTK